MATVSFTVKGRKSQDFVEAVDKATNGELGIRWGSFYSVRLVEEFLGLGKDGIVRVSMVHYNTGECSTPLSSRMKSIHKIGTGLILSS